MPTESLPSSERKLNIVASSFNSKVNSRVTMPIGKPALASANQSPRLTAPSGATTFLRIRKTEAAKPIAPPIITIAATTTRPAPKNRAMTASAAVGSAE